MVMDALDPSLSIGRKIVAPACCNHAIPRRERSDVRVVHRTARIRDLPYPVEQVRSVTLPADGGRKVEARHRRLRDASPKRLIKILAEDCQAAGIAPPRPGAGSRLPTRGSPNTPSVWRHVD